MPSHSLAPTTCPVTKLSCCLPPALPGVVSSSDLAEVESLMSELETLLSEEDPTTWLTGSHEDPSTPPSKVIKPEATATSEYQQGCSGMHREQFGQQRRGQLNQQHSLLVQRLCCGATLHTVDIPTPNCMTRLAALLFDEDSDDEDLDTNPVRDTLPVKAAREVLISKAAAAGVQQTSFKMPCSDEDDLQPRQQRPPLPHPLCKASDNLQFFRELGYGPMCEAKLQGSYVCYSNPAFIEQDDPYSL